MLEREFALTHCTHDPLFQLVDACGWDGWGGAWRSQGPGRRKVVRQFYGDIGGVFQHDDFSNSFIYSDSFCDCDVHEGVRILRFVPVAFASGFLSEVPECPRPRLSCYPLRYF